MAHPPEQRRPAHHPGDDQLMAYAAGELAEAPSLVVATHLALCPACRRQVADYEALGGQLLDELPGELLASGSLSHTLEMLDVTAPSVAAPRKPAAVVLPAPAGIAVPQPLSDYMSRAWADKAAWRKAIPGLRTLELKAEGAKVWIMEIAAGKPIPNHGHTGQEMVLVLSGGYHDGLTAYGPGDVQLSGIDTIHEPVADAGAPCLCLVLVEGSIRPTSWLGRIVSGFLGY